MKLYVTPTSPYARLAMIARLEKGLDAIELFWTRTREPDDPMLASSTRPAGSRSCGSTTARASRTPT